jgi:hypothetical protein
MAKVKEMSYFEKFEGILDFAKLVEGFAPDLVRNELGKEKVEELRSIWETKRELIPKDASDKEKYEVAYRNFMNSWVNANKFMGEHQGDAGTAKFMQAAISAWKTKYARSAPLLRVEWALSPKSAFRVLAKKLAYQLQVFSPFSVAELTENRLVLSVTPCKILTDQNGGSFCTMACQNIIPSWLQAQFNVKMNLKRQGANCTAIFEPF